MIAQHCELCVESIRDDLQRMTSTDIMIDLQPIKQRQCLQSQSKDNMHRWGGRKDQWQEISEKSWMPTFANPQATISRPKSLQTPHRNKAWMYRGFPIKSFPSEIDCSLFGIKPYIVYWILYPECIYAFTCISKLVQFFFAIIHNDKLCFDLTCKGIYVLPNK